MSAVVVAVCCFLFASTSLPALENYSVHLRIVGALILTAPILWRKLARAESLPSFGRAVFAACLGYGTYLVASTLGHGNFRAFALGLLSLCLTVCVSSVILHYYRTAQIVDGSFFALLFTCCASIVAYQVQPDLALENLRLRGVLENANVLGFVAFGLGGISLAARRSVVRAFFGLMVALACLFLSGSRASFLALVVLALALAIGKLPRAKAAIFVLCVSAMSVWFMVPDDVSSMRLFRTTDTRSAGFEILGEAMTDSFWIGRGELPEVTAVAGSVPAAGITGGFLGLLGLGIMYFGLLRNFAASRPRAFSLVIAGIVHSFFESWILSFSAPMLLTFFVLLVGFVKLDAADESSLMRSREMCPESVVVTSVGRRP